MDYKKMTDEELTESLGQLTRSKVARQKLIKRHQIWFRETQRKINNAVGELQDRVKNSRDLDFGNIRNIRRYCDIIHEWDTTEVIKEYEDICTKLTAAEEGVEIYSEKFSDLTRELSDRNALEATEINNENTGSSDNT